MTDDGFPRVDAGAWKARVETELRGADFAATLQSELPGALQVEPLYVEGPAITPVVDSAHTINCIEYPRSTENLSERLKSDAAQGIAQWWLRAESGVPLPSSLPSLGHFLIDLLPHERPVATPGKSFASDALSAIARGDLEVEQLPAIAASDAVDWIAPGALFREAGAHETLELAILLSAGIEWLRAGVSPAKSSGRLIFRTALGRDLFIEIAKLRALRTLWSQILTASDMKADQPIVHAVTSTRMHTQQDRWVNMLRGTGASFSAQIGGADWFTPRAFLKGDQAAERVARNTATILAKESQLNWVRDPAAGSYYIEQLSDQIGRRAWTELQSIESAGGFAAALASGEIADKVNRSWEDQQKRLNKGSDSLVGVTAFANLDEAAQTTSSTDSDASFAPRRDAASFEALRRRAHALGTNATITLRALSSSPADQAAASYSTSALAVGGIRGESDDTPGRPVAILCGADLQELAAAVKELRASGTSFIIHAGSSDDSGADATLHMGCDLHAVLDQTLTHLESGAM